MVGCVQVKELKTDGKGTILEGFHPSATSAIQYIFQLPIKDQMRIKESMASCALSGNKYAEICYETYRRMTNGEPVSDRYALGLAWFIKEMEETR